MGKHDNKKTPKMRRRKSQKKLKGRLKKRAEATKAERAQA